jgi:hypothetical protein
MSRLARWLGRGGRFGWHADQAIALTKTPAPGPARTLPRAAPAPGHLARHKTGGLEYAVEVFRCGCILLFDGHGRITGTTPCAAPDLLDEEIRDLLT